MSEYEAMKGIESIKGNYQSTSHDYGPPVGRQRGGNLPDVDEQHGQLQDGPATKLFAPRRPQLAADGVGDQIDHLAGACLLLANVKGLGQRLHGVGKDGRVEVHRHLHAGHRGQVHPLLPSRPAVGQLVVAFDFGQFALGDLAFFGVGGGERWDDGDVVDVMDVMDGAGVAVLALRVFFHERLDLIRGDVASSLGV